MVRLILKEIRSRNYLICLTNDNKVVRKIFILRLNLWFFILNVPILSVEVGLPSAHVRNFTCFGFRFQVFGVSVFHGVLDDR